MLDQNKPVQIPAQPGSPSLRPAGTGPSLHAPHTIAPGGQRVVPTASAPPTEAELEPIGLVDEGQADGPAKTITAVGGITSTSVRKSNWRRQPNLTHTGAVRLRTFHGKLSREGLEYLDNQVNEWLDAHPDVEIKNVTSTVGTFEGKIRELALVLNIWY
jgi:hypothetical protein